MHATAAEESAAGTGGSMTRPRSVPASYLVPLVVLATACSSASGPAQPLGTVLFTNPGSERNFEGPSGWAASTGVRAADPGPQAGRGWNRRRLQSAGRVQWRSWAQIGALMGGVLI